MDTKKYKRLTNIPGFASMVGSGPQAGVLIMVLTTAFFATSDTIAKLIGESVPLLVMLWVRYLFQAGVLGVWNFQKAGMTAFRVGNIKLQVVRSLLLLANSACTFAGLRHLPLPVTTSLAMMAPLIATLLAATVLGDTVSKGKWAMVILGFLGMLLVVRPGGGGFSWAILFPMGGAITFACYQVVSSRLSKLGDPIMTNFYTAFIAVLVLSLLVWADQAETVPQLARMTVGSWATVMAMATVATLGQLTMLQALRRAPLSVLTPFSYGQLGFATLFSWAIFGQVPDSWVVIGMAIIALSGAGTVLIHHRGHF